MGRFKNNGFKDIVKYINNLTTDKCFTVTDVNNSLTYSITEQYIKGVLSKLIKCGFLIKNISDKENSKIKIIVNYNKIKQIPTDLTSGDIDIMSRTTYIKQEVDEL